MEGRSLKARASRNSDVAFGLETTAHEWKLFTWRPRPAGVLPHGVCSYHEISEATSRSPYRISRFPEFLRLRKCRFSSTSSMVGPLVVARDRLNVYTFLFNFWIGTRILLFNRKYDVMPNIILMYCIVLYN